MKTSIIGHILEQAKRIRSSAFAGLVFVWRPTLAGLLILALSWPLILPFSARAESLKSGPRSTASTPTASYPQNTETFTIFGPHRFTRLTGQPINVVQNFSLPANAVAPFTVMVENGAPEGSNRVSSAIIKLNGTDLFTSSDFNQNVSSLSKPVALTAANILEVKLTSAAGSYLTVTLTATRQANQPVLESVVPARTTQGQTLNVTLQGTNTHWVAGQTRASLGGEVAVGGAGYGELGPVTVVNSTTAIAAVVVSPTAALEPRTAQVITPLTGGAFESLSLPNGFAVDAATPPGASSTSVSTIAGSATISGFADGNGSQARFQKLSGIAIGPDDAIYLADSGNQRIRVVRSQTVGGTTTWTVSTLAGNGTAGFADGSGASARFNNPQGVAVDANGVVYVADTANNRIRRIAVDGSVSTLAGDGTPGLQDGAAGQARFNAPQGVATDNQGTVYVADTGNSAVRMINAGGTVSTLAGDGSVGSSDSPGARFDGLVGIAVDGQNVYVYLSDTGNHRIRRLDVTGTVITIAGAERGFRDGSSSQARFAEPSGIAIDSAGKIIIADAVNSLVRSVDPNLATTGSNQTVTTLAGTGIRGLVDGAGDVARFFTPRGLAVSNSSTIIVADTGNQVLRRILLPPIIHAITPASARIGDTITINGERFDGRGSERNVVRFTRSQQAGGGQTLGLVTQATRTSLTVVVPTDAATGPVTVETEGGTATSPTDFVVDQFPVPVITDFNPKRGTPGTQVILAGTTLKVGANDSAVTFAGSNGNRLPALVSSSSATEVRTTVPNGAITGVIELSHVGGTAATATPFNVDTEQDFQLTVAPSATTAVQGGLGTYVVYVTSQQTTFSQLASLTATGLPAGITATFDPAQITAGANATLTLSLSGTITAGSYPFTIHGVASVGGHNLERTAGATLNVMTGGQTTLSGRVLSTDSEPIIGATASLDGKTAMTDAAGSFLLTGVTAGTNRPLMVDGRTASSPNKTYPIIIEPANIVAGQANVNPYTFYLPPIDTQYEVEVVPGQNTVASNPRVPGLQMTIPPGANLRNRDGSPVTRVSITPLAIDRVPAPLPSNVATGLVFTSQPGGAITDVPMPVIYPNLLGTNPGTQVNLYAFNHDTVQWYIYGTGTVSSDGRTIVPNINPSTGGPYGLPDFSWHFPDTSPDGDPGPSDSCPSGMTGGPVDLSTGMKIEKTTDISFGGSRGNLSLTRIYTTDLANRCSGNPFGCGTTHNFAVRLTGSWTSGGAGRLVMPEEATGTLFNYSRTETDGALVFITTGSVSQLGDVVRRLTDGTLVHRAADGSTMRFDSSGKLIANVDRKGNTTTLSYTGSNLTRITDSVGRTIVLEYSGNQIISATDPLGKVWRYSYNNILSQLASATDPSGNVIRYTYGSRGSLTSITDARGNKVKELIYDGNGRVIEQRFPDGGVERFSYVLSGRIVTTATMTNTRGGTEVKRFSATGYVVGTTDALGQSATIERNLVNNLPTATVGSCGCPEAARQFDERGNMTLVTDQLGNTEKFEYEPIFGNITKATDKLGRVTTYTYNSRGNISSTTNALNQTTTYTYNQDEELVTITNPMNQTVRMEYDAFGNMVATVDALGNRTTMEYDGIGRLVATTDPLNRRSSMEYDALDRVVKVIDPSGAATLFTYDPNGNLSSVKDALAGQSRMSYDQKNRLVSQVDQIGRTERVHYNARDEVVSIISPSGRTTHFSYDSRGQLSTMTDSANGVVRYSYDSDGNLTTSVNQRGGVTTYTYDQLSRPVGMRDPLGQTTQITFDAADRLASKIDRLGRRTEIEYDQIDRPSRMTLVDAAITYSYDPASRLTRIEDSTAGAVEWTYDAAGRMLSETSPAGTVGYTYNASDQRIIMTAGNRQPVTYGYDSAGRLETITQQSGVFKYSYDQLSRVVKLDRANGVTTTYGYDAVDRLDQLRHADASGQVLEEFRYTYTGDDEIASLTSQFNSQLLASEKTVGQADANNRIMQFGTSTFSFDDEGKVITKTDVQAGTANYQWDARGRLAQVTLPNGKTVKHFYDALGRRSSRNEDGATTQFLYDGMNVVLDTNSNGSVTEYLNGADTDEKLQQTSATTGPLYFLQDHLGSTVALTNAAGSVAERIQYDAFGASTASALTRYTFTGREVDGATGLLYNRARWYDPQSARFISEDPSGVKGGLNFYAYVENDPINASDPFGLQKKGQTPRRGGSGQSPGYSNPRKGRRYTPPTSESHPPHGVKPGCTNGDSCPAIVAKMGMLAGMIVAHQNWDWDVPSPRGGQRHKQEISDLWNAWANCQTIFARKCKGCPPPPPVPARNPQPVPRRHNGPTMEELRLQEESARAMVRFWETILYGSLIGGGIVIAGPAALPAAGRALIGIIRGGGGRLVPVTP